MLFDEIVATSDRVAATRARSEKVAHLADLLRRLAPDEIEPAVSYLSGRLPQGRIGLGWAALGAARDVPAAERPAQSIGDVHAEFERLAATTGPGSTAERARLVAGLFRRSTVAERDFLLRLIAGELRQGALAGIATDALARAAGVPLADVRRALMVEGDLAAVARAALTAGAAGLARFALRVFTPLQPMLAQPADDLDEALGALGEAALDWKIDGARVQVHKDGDEVRVFSRRLNEVTAAVPEIVEIARALPPRRLVLDGEAIALRDDGTPHPFQVTMRRMGRKENVAELRGELPLSPFFFDILHADGEDLLDRPAGERFDLLRAVLPGELLVPRIVTADAAAARRFLEDALARGHEGVMAKSLAATYEAGNRGSAWLKVKATHTLDLVVLAAEWGHGRRRGWLSNLHLGARDPARGGFVMLGKTFKGLTDAMLARQTERLLALEIGRDAATVHVRPELVVEIAFGDVQASPQYPAGLALRFARVKRYRDDKTAAEADTIDAVRALFRG
ncbi:MAG: ATP-dependent DNA ligase [Acidobacteria bacterium]|nr:ATP-dependent DNA ligase [Acidobacteriota bacterium]